MLGSVSTWMGYPPSSTTECCCLGVPDGDTGLTSLLSCLQGRDFNLAVKMAREKSWLATIWIPGARKPVDTVLVVDWLEAPKPAPDWRARVM